MSKMPLGNGPVVGYREVTVWLGANGEFGKTRHTFRSVLPPDGAADPPPATMHWPFSRRTTYEWKRGQELGATEYNVAGQVQQRTALTDALRDQGSPEPTTTRKFRGLSINS